MSEIKKSKSYMKAFKENNFEKVHQKVECELCGGSYTYFNKQHHQKTRKHLFKIMENQIKTLKNENL